MADQAGREVVTVDEIESLLSRIPGVVTARIVVNDWGAIEEVHILSTLDRAPKQMVRDVESALAARWGITIDHKKISVAQLKEMESTFASFRLKMVSVQIHTDTLRGRMTVQVTLGRSDDDELLFQGVAEGSNAGLHSLRTAGQATVNALNEIVDPSNVLIFEDATSVHLSGREIVTVTLVVITPRGHEEVLVGAVVSRGNVAEAVVRATLDAANRRIVKLAARKPKGREEEDEPAVVGEDSEDTTEE